MSPRLIQILIIGVIDLFILLILTLICLFLVRANSSTLIGGPCTSDSNCEGYETATIYCNCGTCSCIDDIKYEAPSSDYTGSNYRCFIKSGYSCTSSDECLNTCSSGTCS
ncbi:hypothetical protein BpHYR1_013405 [Brachionus plicatilis]|uniref:Uncharacterized protein n=1 Tax=Brachionus plicatilis TaxID=10195 RepID=A0A3M7Q870_BRAPC|nr:hypothetical protein BpHYR1_013405 [Brachionus plicatilis]